MWVLLLEIIIMQGCPFLKSSFGDLKPLNIKLNWGLFSQLLMSEKCAVTGGSVENPEPVASFLENGRYEKWIWRVNTSIEKLEKSWNVKMLA